VFQCSSASRKFLNYASQINQQYFNMCFSALQRAENSSIPGGRRPVAGGAPVSVLFSEPKIPQCWSRSRSVRCGRCFSALQRAENSSIIRPLAVSDNVYYSFQCSSASRKFLNRSRPDR